MVQKDEVPELLQQMHSSVVGGCHFGINAIDAQKNIAEMVADDVRSLIYRIK